MVLGATSKEYPVLQFNARLLDQNGSEELQQSIVLSPPGYPADTVPEQLQSLRSLFLRAERIIGHNIYWQLQLLLRTTSRVGDQELASLLTPPRFGFDGGETAAVCLRQLATEYFDLVGWPQALYSDSLATIHRVLCPNSPGRQNRLTACQEVYNFLRDFQQQNQIVLKEDVWELG